MKNERDLERHSERLDELEASVGSLTGGANEEERWRRREETLRTWTRRRIEELGQAHGAVINRLSAQVSGRISFNCQ